MNEEVQNLHTPQSFSLMIEKKAKDEDSTYFDAIVSYCEGIDIEPKQVARLIQPQLKQKMQIELEKLRMIKPESSSNSLVG